MASSASAATESVDAFVAQWAGQFPDYDNVYGSQCVDLFDYYNRDVVGAPAQGFGNAYTIYGAASSSYYDKHPVGDGYTPAKGDVAVWNQNSPGSGGAGHVGVVMSVVNSTTISILEANSSGTNDGPPDTASNINNSAVITGNHSTAYLTGYLHPRSLGGGGGGASSSNVAANGGFENGWGPWTTMAGTNYVDYQTGQVSGESARSGLHYGATNTSQSGGGIYQNVAVSASAGNVYCASAWVRTQYPATGGSGQFVVWLLGGSYNENGVASFTGLSNGANWRQVQTCVSASTSHTQMRIQFYPTVNGPTVDIDDVDVHASMAANGGFENGWGPWTTMAGTNYVDYQTGQVSGESARSGLHYGATNTSQSGGGIYQNVAVSASAGNVYCASAWVRTQYPATGGSGQFVVWLLGGSYNENGVASFTGLSNGANWRQVQTCVSASTSHTQMRIQFYPTVNGPTVDIDDVDVH